MPMLFLMPFIVMRGMLDVAEQNAKAFWQAGLPRP